MSLHRRKLLQVAALTAGGMAAAAVPTGLLPEASAAGLPSPPFGAGIEDYAAHVPQTACIGVAQPGVLAFRRMVLGAYPSTRSVGIVRACGTGGRSEHKEGRAWDWGVRADRPAEAAAAREVLDWLLAGDPHGNCHAYARRIGLMYVIWNRRVWTPYRERHVWQHYPGADPHVGHMHFSFTWPGALKQTSFWTGVTPPRSGHLWWSPWMATGDPTWSAPAATAWSSQRSDVFSVHDGRLLHRWFIAGSGWDPGRGWQDLGAPAASRLNSQPATTSRGQGLLDVFVRGEDRRLWRRSYSPQTGWTAWGSLDGDLRSAPAATSWASDHVTVAALTAGGLATRAWKGGWGPWEAIPDSLVTTGPALTTMAPGQMNLFARGLDGQLVHRGFADGRWHRWDALGGRLASATPAAASIDPGTLEVFVVGTNHAVYHQRYRNHAWTGFQSLGGRVKNGLGAAPRYAAHVEVFAQAPDGRLYQRWTC